MREMYKQLQPCCSYLRVLLHCVQYGLQVPVSIRKDELLPDVLRSRGRRC